MKVTTGYVLAKVRKSIGAQTAHGIEQDLAPIFDYYRSPVAETYCNAFTQQQPTQVEFPFDAEHSIALAASISVAAESGGQAQSIIDEAFDKLRAVMLGEQDAATLTPREQMLCAGFFSLGLKAGIVAGVNIDDLRRAALIAKRGRASGARTRNQKSYIPAGHRQAVNAVMEAYCAAQVGESPSLADLGQRIQEACGVSLPPSKASVKRWLRKYREVGDVHGE